MKIGQTSVVHFLSRIGVTVVGFIATIYLARELGADVLGSYYLLISLLYWLVVFGDFGVVSSVRKRLSEADSTAGVLTAGILLKAGLFGVLSILLIFGSDVINAYIGADVTLWLVAMLLAKLNFDLVTAVLDGQHNVHLSSLLTTADRMVRSLVQISLTAVGVGLTGLFVGYIAGMVVAVAAGLYFARTRIRRPTRADFRSVYSFARFSWLSGVKGRSFLSMDTIILGLFAASNSVVGVYEVAWNVSSIFAIFSVSLNRAMFPEISSLSADEIDRIRNLTSAAIAYAGLFLIPGLVGAALVGDVVLSVYGNEFTTGATVLVVLVFAQLVYAYEEQFTTVLEAMDHPNVVFRINAVFLTVNLGINLGLVPVIGSLGAAIGTTVSSFVGLVLGYRGLSQRLDFQVPWRELFRQVLAAVVMSVVVLLGRMLFGGSLPVVAGIVLVGAVVYVTLLIVISRQFRTTVLENLPIDPPTLS